MARPVSSEAQKFVHLRAILVDFPDTNHQELPGAWMIPPFRAWYQPAYDSESVGCAGTAGAGLF